MSCGHVDFIDGSFHTMKNASTVYELEARVPMSHEGYRKLLEFLINKKQESITATVVDEVYELFPPPNKEQRVRKRMVGEDTTWQVKTEIDSYLYTSAYGQSVKLALCTEKVVREPESCVQRKLQYTNKTIRRVFRKGDHEIVLKEVFENNNGLRNEHGNSLQLEFEYVGALLKPASTSAMGFLSELEILLERSSDAPLVVGPGVNVYESYIPPGMPGGVEYTALQWKLTGDKDAHGRSKLVSMPGDVNGIPVPYARFLAYVDNSVIVLARPFILEPYTPA